MADFADSLHGDLGDRYVVERELGHGATATVYLARDVKHDRLVALKVLSPDLALAVPTERFLREIRTTAKLSHPHIVPLFDSGSASGRPFYVMPYIRGESLGVRLARGGPLPVEEALRIARQVAGALDHAHRHGVIHRDIKPGNILLEEGHAWVADFGIARAIAATANESVTQTGVTIGTPAYMSPEQAMGDARLDARSDVYSLGCVLYEMLTGTLPFNGPDIQSVLNKHLVEPLPSVRDLRPGIPEQVERLIEVALAKKREDRFATAAEFAQALSLEGAGPLTPTRTQPVKARRGGWDWRRATKRPATVVGIVGLLALAGLGGLKIVWDEPPTIAAATGKLDPTRIAILYFDDLSPGGRLAHIAGGLTHDLINVLSEVKPLTVISPEGVRPFRGASVLLDTVARSLGVGTVVAGSVAESEGRLRVSVRMIDPGSGAQLLSHTIERPLGELFALQDQISEEVSVGLRQRLGREVQLREQRAGTKSVAAWELVQRADRMSEDARALNGSAQSAAALRTLHTADLALERAESLDRSWTVPIVTRGWVAFSRGVTEPSQLAHRFRLGLAHAERALALQATDPDALELRGVLRFRLWTLSPAETSDTLLVGAERDLRLATEAKPTVARAWYTLASLHVNLGRFAEAHAAARKALEADAYLSEVQAVLGLLFLSAVHLGRADEARAVCDQGLTRFPGDPRLRDCHLTLLGWFGRGRDDVAEAWDVLNDNERNDSLGAAAEPWAYRRMLVAVLLARTGLRDSAEAVIQRTRADSARRPPIGGVALLAEAYARLLLRQRDEALRVIEACVRARPRIRHVAQATPWFQDLRADPRFQAAVSATPPGPR